MYSRAESLEKTEAKINIGIAVNNSRVKETLMLGDLYALVNNPGVFGLLIGLICLLFLDKLFKKKDPPIMKPPLMRPRRRTAKNHR